jgi:VanZ family protein
MFKQLLSNTAYRKRARTLAIGWTLLIFFLCLIPGNEIPNVKIPFIDKWTHLILFGIFTFLWLFAYPSLKFSRLLFIFLVSALLGWLVEVLQGQLTVLHRSQDNMDTLADAVGGLLGVIIFYFLAKGRKTADSSA